MVGTYIAFGNSHDSAKTNRQQRGLAMNTDLLHIAIAVTFVFAFVNGFHDGGNVIATIVSSRSMPPTRALILGAAAEFTGPLLLGTAVAGTMATSILKPELMEGLRPREVYLIIISGVGAAILWKIPGWILGLPSSGSHALIGGLVGSGWMSLGVEGLVLQRIIVAVVLPLLLSPLIGLILGSLVFLVIRALCWRAHRGLRYFFAFIQRPTMVFLAVSHGSNDAQKSMGVISLALGAGIGIQDGTAAIPLWVQIGCAAALALGLTAGGWRIVKTVGYGIARNIEAVHSFSSQLAASLVVLVASLTGGPVSTTQVVASSVMGVGAARRLSGVRWSASASIMYAWFLTAPVAAGLGAGAYWCLHRLLP